MKKQKIFVSGPDEILAIAIFIYMSLSNFPRLPFFYMGLKLTSTTVGSGWQENHYPVEHSQLVRWILNITFNELYHDLCLSSPWSNDLFPSRRGPLDALMGLAEKRSPTYKGTGEHPLNII